MVNGERPASMPITASRSRRLFYILLLLEIALLFFQQIIGGAIKKERAALCLISENIVREQEGYSYLAGLLKTFEAEEVKLKQSLPVSITVMTPVLALTRKMLDASGMTGEVREKVRDAESVVLEIECEGPYIGLAILLDRLKEMNYAVRLNRVRAEALDSWRISVMAEIAYALQAAPDRIMQEEL